MARHVRGDIYLCPCCQEEKYISKFYIRKTGHRSGTPFAYCKSCQINYVSKGRKKRVARKPRISKAGTHWICCGVTVLSTITCPRCGIPGPSYRPPR